MKGAKAAITVDQTEKREVIGILYWDPISDTVEVDTREGIPPRKALALIKRFVRGSRFKSDALAQGGSGSELP